MKKEILWFLVMFVFHDYADLYPNHLGELNLEEIEIEISREQEEKNTQNVSCQTCLIEDREKWMVPKVSIQLSIS